MSAFIVDKKHIDAMCKFAQDHNMIFEMDGFKFHSAIDLNHIGQILVNQNHASVNFRYSEFEAPYVYQFSPEIKTKLSTMQIVKACHCYRYQSCETKDFKETVAFKICEKIRETALSHYIAECEYANTPQYDAASWEITQ